MARIQYLKLITSVGVSQLAGVIGSVFTSSSVSTWFTTLERPWFDPPAWVFGPVWLTLYTLMGVSLYLVWTGEGEARLRRMAFIAFGVQLMLNSLWSILFFGLRFPLAAFVEIIFLWLAIVLTMAIFRKISATATYLLVPYLLWVTFAAILNLSYVMLN